MANDLIAPGEISALLGQGTDYRGTLTFEGRVRLDGRFEGEIFSGGALIVGEGAEIRGELEVGTFIALGGEVWGTVRARELVELHAGAIVHGDIETPRLFIDKGAIFDGRCSMGDGRTPERHPLSGEQLLDELGRDATESDLPPRIEPEISVPIEGVPDPLSEELEEEDTRVTAEEGDQNA